MNPEKRKEKREKRKEKKEPSPREDVDAVFNKAAAHMTSYNQTAGTAKA